VQRDAKDGSDTTEQSAVQGFKRRVSARLISKRCDAMVQPGAVATPDPMPRSSSDKLGPLGRQNSQKNPFQLPARRVSIAKYFKDKNDTKVIRVMPMLVIHPENKAKIVWDGIILLLVVYGALSLPFYAGFDINPTFFFKSFDWFTDVLFVMDVLAGFRTAYFFRQNLITDWKLIGMRYLKSWFLLDLVSVIPFELFPGASFDVSFIKALKCVRLLRLGRFFKKRAHWKSMNAAKDFVLFVLVAVCAHWVRTLLSVVGSGLCCLWLGQDFVVCGLCCTGCGLCCL
jgi:hypothetical protein